MVRSTARRWHTTTPTEPLPIEALSVKALTKVLEKHKIFEAALEEHSAGEQVRLKRNQDEVASATRELPSVQHQVAQLSRRIAELTTQLRSFKIGILGKALRESGIEYDRKLYRPEAMPLIEAVKTTYEQYFKWDDRKRSLEQSLWRLNHEWGLPKPSTVSKVRDQLKTFVFDLTQIDIARVEQCIAKKKAQALLERERERYKLEQTRARAAAYDNRQRQQAKSVRNALRKQLHEMPYCPYCEAPLSFENTHADHIYPVAKGGLSTRRNMIFICASCNTEKRQLTLRAFLKKMGYPEASVHQRLELLGKDF